MLEMLTSKDTATGCTVLMAAASTGSRLTFEAALHATVDALGRDNVKVRSRTQIAKSRVQDIVS